MTGECENTLQLPVPKHEGTAPVGFLIERGSGEEPGGAFEELVGVLIAAGAEGVLQGTADV